jgi:lysophospholipase L1-like esterase
MFGRLLILFSVAISTLAVPPKSSQRWEKEVAAFEAADRTNAPAPGGTLFVGSSSIRLWTNLSQMFPDWKVVRRGVGGSCLYDANALFDRLILPYKPAEIVLYAGENDVADGRSPEEVFADFKTFAGKVKMKLPSTKIYYLSMKPSPSRWYLWPQISEGNAMIKRYASRHANITFIDVGKPLLKASGLPDPALFQKDQLHLNGKGYELWAGEIRKVIKH